MTFPLESLGWVQEQRGRCIEGKGKSEVCVEQSGRLSEREVTKTDQPRRNRKKRIDGDIGISLQKGWVSAPFCYSTLKSKFRTAHLLSSRL